MNYKQYIYIYIRTYNNAHHARHLPFQKHIASNRKNSITFIIYYYNLFMIEFIYITFTWTIVIRCAAYIRRVRERVRIMIDGGQNYMYDKKYIRARVYILYVGAIMIGI